MSLKAKPDDLVFVAAKRTAFGKFGGSFSKLSATDLAVESSKAALAQAGVAASKIDAVIMGNVIQSSADAAYLARHVGLKVGAELRHTALTVNRLCGSGFEAIAQGAYQLRMEGSQFVLVGGTENMTQVPYVLRGARFGYRMGNGELEDALTQGLTDSYVQLPMAMTAENLAEKYSISRAEVDEFALMGQKRCAAASEKGLFKDEIAAVKVGSGKSEALVERDEHPRADATLESIAKLPALFKKGGVVTAANASGIVDGACSLVMCTQATAEREGLKVLGRLHAWAAAGCDPKIKGIGPVPATQKALQNFEKSSGRKVSVSDMKLVELNEAFGAQALAVMKELGLKSENTNVNGGAIAIGHPLAASGARLTTHLLYELARRGGGLGLATACIGGGQGMSLIIEV